MTAAYIDFHATDRPEAVAVIRDGESITYVEFARHVRKFRHALRGLGLRAGATAAISCDDFYFNWLLRLACEELRVVTAALLPAEKPGALDIVLSPDAASAGGTPHHPITTAWLDGVLESGEEDHEPAPEPRPDDPVRIVVTSGTTGTPKRLLFTRRITEAHIAHVLWLAELTRRTRYLQVWPVAASGPSACARAGGTVVIENRMGVPAAIAAHGINHTTMPPLAIKRTLDELPPDFAKPARLTIWSFGAPISPALREQALARLATDIVDNYASNEADSISSIKANPEIGTIWPGVRVEVVDADDRPLPFGEVGQIRVQTECMVDGYLDFPEAQGRIFRDGWFYAGDVGILHDAHRLQVLGRGDDVLNVGGRKITPEAVENRVRKIEDPADVGVCSVPNRDGIEEVCIAVVGQRSSDEELLRRLTQAFQGLQLGRFHVVKVPAIPRTEGGKPRRKALKDIVAATLRRNGAS